jgi:lipoate-protein ligase B
MALNVDPDLDPFCWVEPCGLEGVSMTSMQQQLDKPVGVQNVKASITAAFAAVFNVRLQPCSPADLDISGFDTNERQTRVT